MNKDKYVDMLTRAQDAFDRILLRELTHEISSISDDLDVIYEFLKAAKYHER